MGITKTVAEYISENCLSVSQISSDTGIAPEKLTAGTDQTLTAQELLKVCSYLRVRPEDMLVSGK